MSRAAYHGRWEDELRAAGLHAPELAKLAEAALRDPLVSAMMTVVDRGAHGVEKLAELVCLLSAERRRLVNELALAETMRPIGIGKMQAPGETDRELVKRVQDDLLQGK